MDDWSGLPWVDTLMNSSTRARTRLKNTILNGIKFVNASWYRKNLKDTKLESKLRKQDPKMLELFKFLNSKKMEFIGFSPIVPYIKEKGTADDLFAYWHHNNGVPALLYKHSELPILIIAGPSIRLNDSLLNEIDANSNLEVLLKGISM